MHALRVAVRQLRRRPLFTALSLAVLSLGLGAALTVVEIADTVVVRPLPFADESRLVTAWQTDIRGGGSRITVAGADFLDWQREANIFEKMAAVSARGFNVFFGDRPERIDGAIVSSDFFALLGATPLLGQLRLDAGPRTAVLSENVWRARFGSDPNVVGRTVSIDGEPVVVSAVAPEAG